MSLDLLVRGLFDYAGMFPPAQLSFEDALAESARLPETLHRPDLVAADMVLTPESLARLDPAARGKAGFDRPMRVCVVGVAADKGPEQATALADREDLESDVQIASLELHTDDPARDAGPVADARDRAEGTFPVFLEPKWDPAAWASRGPDLWRTLDQVNRASRVVGLKVRCAGETALDARTLALILPETARRRIPFKATQGLHHPFAGDPKHGNDHGFLNLTVALRMAQVLDLPIPELVELLQDAEPAHFVLDAGVGWKEHRVLAQQVQEAMQAVPFTIGSCSLSEPDDALQDQLD